MKVAWKAHNDLIIAIQDFFDQQNANTGTNGIRVLTENGIMLNINFSLIGCLT